MTAALRPFVFERDTIAYRNELVWEYAFDPATGLTTTRRAVPPPTYWHYCFVLVRAARQFLYHARFDPAQPPAEAQERRGRIRAVLSRSPREPTRPEDQVVVPGFAALRDFSRAHEGELKAGCGGGWQSYFLRSHWRMVFPYSRRSQEKTAAELVRRVRANRAPIVHLVRFPQLTINHGVLLFDLEEDAAEIRFRAYDPNLPAQPSTLTYRRAERTFFLPRSLYWAGGRVDVMEIYRNWLY